MCDADRKPHGCAHPPRQRCPEVLGGVTAWLSTGKEEAGSELVTFVAVFCNTLSNGRFYSAGKPMEPEDAASVARPPASSERYVLEQLFGSADDRIALLRIPEGIRRECLLQVRCESVTF